MFAGCPYDPEASQMIFLDNASTTSLCDKARDALIYHLDHTNGNPSSLHNYGNEAKRVIEDSRMKIAGLLDCSAKEIYFTSGATESINTVLKNFWHAYPKAARRILTSTAEHSATTETCKFLKSNGIEVINISPSENGRYSDEKLREALGSKPGLVSLMHVNNETGAITEPRKISEMIKSICPRAKLHIDAAQSFGKFGLSPYKDGIDYLSASAHKLHGPKGVGLLFARRNALLIPLLHGGGQESKLRSGTENTAGIAAFAEASDEAWNWMMRDNTSHIEQLRTAFLKELSASHSNYFINSPEDGSKYILNISFMGVRPEVLLRCLDSEGIYVSTSSACSSRNRKPSRVLKAMGFDDERASSAIRISFSRYNTIDEVTIAAKAFVKAVSFL